jgi:hypothetical protein
VTAQHAQPTNSPSAYELFWAVLDDPCPMRTPEPDGANAYEQFVAVIDD